MGIRDVPPDKTSFFIILVQEIETGSISQDFRITNSRSNTWAHLIFGLSNRALKQEGADHWVH